MTRRVFVAEAFLPLLAVADAAEDAWDTVATMAAALSEGNAVGFLKRCDKDLPGYQELVTRITGLLEQADVESQISPLDNDGGPAERTLRLDWQLRLKPKGWLGPLSDAPEHSPGDLRVEEREEAVTVVLRRTGKQWRAGKLDPIAFFAAPKFK